MSDQTLALCGSLLAFTACSVLVVVSNYYCRKAVDYYFRARVIGVFTGAAAVRDAAASWAMTPGADVVSYMEFYADSIEAEASEMVAKR